MGVVKTERVLNVVKLLKAVTSVKVLMLTMKGILRTVMMLKKLKTVKGEVVMLLTVLKDLQEWRGVRVLKVLMVVL